MIRTLCAVLAILSLAGCGSSQGVKPTPVVKAQYYVVYYTNVVNEFGDSIGQMETPEPPTSSEIMAQFPNLFGTGDPFTEATSATIAKVENGYTTETETIGLQ